MTEAELLSLAYQKQAAGDARPLADIVASIQRDAAALFAPAAPAAPGPSDVIGGGRIVYPDGRKVETRVYGDGRMEEVRA